MPDTPPRELQPITLKRVAQAVAFLRRSGQKPTYKAIIACLGGGSRTTIARYLRELQSDTSLELQGPETELEHATRVLRETGGQDVDLLQDVVGHAMTEADRQRQRLAVLTEEKLQRAGELTALADELNALTQQLRECADQAERELMEIRADVARKKAKAQELREAIAQLKGTPEA